MFNKHNRYIIVNQPAGSGYTSTGLANAGSEITSRVLANRCPGLGLPSTDEWEDRVSYQHWIVDRHREEVQRDHQDMQRLREVFDNMRGRCAYCRMTQQGDSQHDQYRCRREHGQAMQQQAKEWKKRLRGGKQLEKFGGCYICFMPQEWCDRWRERVGAGHAGMYEMVPGGRCQYEDVVMETLAVLELELEEGISGGEEMKRWGQRRRWGHVECYQVIVEVWRRFQRWSERREGIK